jgi:hypothetical protein
MQSHNNNKLNQEFKNNFEKELLFAFDHVTTDAERIQNRTDNEYFQLILEQLCKITNYLMQLILKI